MQLIAPIIPRPVTGLSPTVPLNGSANLAFQPAQSSAPSPVLGFSSTANPTLGNQTLSTLLQTQDVSHTHGHGGGHHGAKSLMPNAARQEMAASEETQLMNMPKKLTNAPKLYQTSDADQADQEDTPADENAKEEGKQTPKEKKDSQAG